MPSTTPLPPARTIADRVDVIRVNARLNVGGIARHVAWLTDGLRDRGYNTLLVAGSVPEGEADMRAFVEAQGVEPLILPEMSREISPLDVVAVWKLYRLLVALRPRIVHTHAAKAGAVGRMAAFLYRWLTPGTLIGRPRRCEVVHTYHGHIFHGYYGRWKSWVFLTIERILARLATDRIVVISPRQFEEIHRFYRVGRADQFAVIRLGLDLGTFAGWATRRHRLRSEIGAADTDILVGIVGRLTEIKDHSFFLRVVARYKAISGTGVRVRFLVFGDGHLRSGLERESRDLGVDQDITFLGMRDDPDVFYPGLDVVALTSRNEGTPLTLIEAMANARSVIATDVGGVADLVGPPAGNSAADCFTICERGILVRSADEDAFTRGLDHLVRDANLRQALGTRGEDFVRTCYSKDRLLVEIAELYDGLLGRNGSGDSSPAPYPSIRNGSQTCGC